MRTLASLIAFVIASLATSAAWADFHQIKVEQVFPGTQGAPNAQYVQLRAYSTGQTNLTNHSVTVHDANGAVVTNGSAMFTTTVGNGANQATILIATAEAATLFNVTADLTMMPVFPLAGGKVCFDTVDCVSWGSYTGTDVGTPAYQALGLRRGQALVRRFDVFGDPVVLSSGDDTNNSANDFRYGAPAPRTNGGTDGTLPSSTCGNGATEGLEQCDDNNTTSNDGCAATCQSEACGDGIVQASEQCDDTNLNNADTCTTSCTTQTPAVDGVIDAGTTTADAGIEMNGGGDGCCQSGTAGSTAWLAALTCVILGRRRRRQPTSRRHHAHNLTPDAHRV